jgi:hypothetical protein
VFVVVAIELAFEQCANLFVAFVDVELFIVAGGDYADFAHWQCPSIATGNRTDTTALRLTKAFEFL